MSEDRSAGRSWIVVLVAMVLLTVGTTVAYLAAPFDPPPNARADTGSAGTVAAEHRIVAVSDDGSLVILDDRDGTLSEMVTAAENLDIVGLEVGAGHEAAFVVDDGGTSGPAIDLVRLRTGEHVRRDTGRHITLGPIAFPQLAKTVERPEVEQIAYVIDRHGAPAIVVENLTTGDRRAIVASSDAPPFRQIDDLVLSPFDNRLFGIGDGGTVLFRLDLDQATTLEEAVTADAPDDGEVFLDGTPLGDGMAVIVERPDGTTGLVRIDRRTLEPTEVLVDDTDDPLVAIDADTAASELLLVTSSGTLFRFKPAGDDEQELLAEGIRLAAW